MAFETWDSFSKFRSEIARSNRYFYSDLTKAFLEEVRKSAKEKTGKISAGTNFCRAQVGCVYDEEEPRPFSKERMLPLRDQATEGRANPKGIPCLYLASSENTAIAEVRPWVGAYVSVANLKTTKALRIVECVSHLESKSILLPATLDPMFKATDEQKENEVWLEINQAFARPIENSDSHASYTPTQILSELFKDEGYDGIGFKSSLSEGYNIALFDLNSVEVATCQVHEVKAVSYQSAIISNPCYYRDK